jgi:succinyl-diaminopimelate desuccinylase
MDTLLETLVGIPSVCNDIPAANRILSVAEDHLRQSGLYIHKYESHKFPSLVATTRKTKTPKVMLAAHLDTVDAPTDLFKLRLENGRYYGRGALDMKSAVSNYLHILREIPDLHKYDIGVMLTTDEEYFGHYGTGMLVGKGFVPEVCVLPDSCYGDNWHIETFAKGCWFGQVTALGVSAHGSKPWEGDSANVKLIRALDAINQLFEGRQRHDTATLNIGMMQGGTSINQIPAAASATLDIRFVEMSDFNKLRRAIASVCNQYDVTLKTIRKVTAPTFNDLEDPFIKTFASHVTTQTGVRPEPFTAYGTTDARYFNSKGVPCILMSPPGGGHHSNEEWLSKEGYEQFRLILRNYLDEVARTPSPASTEALALT